ncbi:hypothetical protein PR048_024545 [Dryococelus australis]|uniref:Uncharacterized protein n=1 Tax=Dryococelus australis TaxID=614101 RepID=A0ABQ9GNX2_9NEOP|nr:hypothetical protein PR048_024545 [Dryococelus australis]
MRIGGRKQNDCLPNEVTQSSMWCVDPCEFDSSLVAPVYVRCSLLSTVLPEDNVRAGSCYKKQTCHSQVTDNEAANVRYCVEKIVSQRVILRSSYTAALNSEVLRADESEARSPRKPADQRHGPTRVPQFGSDPAGNRTRIASVGGEQSSHDTTKAPLIKNVAQWLGRSPPTTTIRARSPPGSRSALSHVGIVLDEAACRRVFSGYSRFPRACIPARLHPRVSFHVMSGDDGHLRVPAGKPVIRKVLPRPGPGDSWEALGWEQVVGLGILASSLTAIGDMRVGENLPSPRTIPLGDLPLQRCHVSFASRSCTCPYQMQETYSRTKTNFSIDGSQGVGELMGLTRVRIRAIWTLRITSYSVMIELPLFIPRPHLSVVRPGPPRTFPLCSIASCSAPTAPCISLGNFCPNSCDRAFDIEVLRADKGETRGVRSSAGLKGRGKREIPEKTHRPTATSGTITNSGNPQ